MSISAACISTKVYETRRNLSGQNKVHEKNIENDLNQLIDGGGGKHEAPVTRDGRLPTCVTRVAFARLRNGINK